MNTTEQLEKLLEEQKALADRIEAAIREAKEGKAPSGVWKPKNGKRYFYVGGNGYVWEDPWEDCDDDNGRYAIGNVFYTEEEAERHVQRLKVKQRLRELAGEFKPDWKSLDERNWCVIYDHTNNILKSACVNTQQGASEIYFPTQEAAQRAIDTLGDDLLVLFEGV